MIIVKLTRLRLYSRPDCHLCEVAAGLLHEVAPAHPARTVNIEEDTALLGRYFLRIPVLQRLDSGRELDWPFDASALRAFLGADA
jgi:hypothetical protein